MKKWKDPELKNLDLTETKELLSCSAIGEEGIVPMDGHHSRKCHHNLPGVNAGNCKYFQRPSGMCIYPGTTIS